MTKGGRQLGGSWSKLNCCRLMQQTWARKLMSCQLLNPVLTMHGTLHASHDAIGKKHSMHHMRHIG
eukprot:1161540-Pelagomonas_calceolata.AAC.16